MFKMVQSILPIAVSLVTVMVLNLAATSSIAASVKAVNMADSTVTIELSDGDLANLRIASHHRFRQGKASGMGDQSLDSLWGEDVPLEKFSRHYGVKDDGRDGDSNGLMVNCNEFRCIVSTKAVERSWIQGNSWFRAQFEVDAKSLQHSVGDIFTKKHELIVQSASGPKTFDCHTVATGWNPSGFVCKVTLPMIEVYGLEDSYEDVAP